MTRIESELHDLYECLMRNDDMADRDTYHTIVGVANDVAEVEDKNDKLRELVRDMWNGMCARAECRHCEHYELKDGQRFVGECEFHRRMCEFGIEVD